MNSKDYKCRPPYIDIQNKAGSTLRKVLNYSMQQCCLVLVSFLANCLSTVSGFSVPLFLGMVIDAIIKGDKDRINEVCLQMLVVILVAGVGAAMSSYYTGVMSHRIQRNLNYDLFLSIVNKDITFFDANKSGDLLSRINADTEVVRNGLGGTFELFLANLIKILVSIFIMCIISWKMTLILMAGLIPTSCVMGTIGVVMHKIQMKIQDLKAELGVCS
jgi:ABC-type multidrug transport system fused ATPase/permease subunit